MRGSGARARPELGACSRVYLTFVVTWLLSVLLFVLYEEPVNIFIRRKLRSKDASVGVQATLFQVNP